MHTIMFSKFFNCAVFSSMFMTCSVSVFASNCSSNFDGKWLHFGIPETFTTPLGDLFATFSDGRSRLPAAIVPPPGLGKIICMRKICKKFDARSMQVYFLQNTTLNDEFRPKRAKTKPRGSKITNIWPDMAPKGTQFEPKGHQNEPKGCQRAAKSGPEINKNTTKKRYLEKGRKRGAPQ